MTQGERDLIARQNRDSQQKLAQEAQNQSNLAQQQGQAATEAAQKQASAQRQIAAEQQAANAISAEQLAAQNEQNLILQQHEWELGRQADAMEQSLRLQKEAQWKAAKPERYANWQQAIKDCNDYASGTGRIPVYICPAPDAMPPQGFEDFSSGHYTLLNITIGLLIGRYQNQHRAVNSASFGFGNNIRLKKGHIRQIQNQLLRSNIRTGLITIPAVNSQIIMDAGYLNGVDSEGDPNQDVPICKAPFTVWLKPSESTQFIAEYNNEIIKLNEEDRRRREEWNRQAIIHNTIYIIKRFWWIPVLVIFILYILF
jgi:hypothetical protein